jgi:cytochrome P450 family 6
MGLFLFLSVALIASLYFWKKKHFSFWTARGFLQADGSFPLGSLGGVGTQMCSTEKYDSLYKQFKGKASAIGFYNFLSPAILPIDPELIKNILVRDFSSFHDRGLYYNKEDDPVSAK